MFYQSIWIFQSCVTFMSNFLFNLFGCFRDDMSNKLFIFDLLLFTQIIDTNEQSRIFIAIDMSDLCPGNVIVYTKDWKMWLHDETIRVLWPKLLEPIAVLVLNYWFRLVIDGKHVRYRYLLLSYRRNGRTCPPFL